MTKKKIILISVIAVLILSAVLAGTFLFRNVRRKELEDSVEAVRKTIIEKSLQCYVIEGSYPESLEYLEENYGLTVNREEMYIVYRAFAENMPPQVIVALKKGEG